MLRGMLRCLTPQRREKINDNTLQPRTAHGRAADPSTCASDCDSSSHNAVTCAVCLDTLEGALETLPCGHVFHTVCIEQSIQSALRHKRTASCPLCACPLAEPCTRRPSGHRNRRESARVLASRQQEDQRLFLSAAEQLGLKLCPACGAAIEKRRGCDHMTCRCGCEFSWRHARPVARCARGSGLTLSERTPRLAIPQGFWSWTRRSAVLTTVATAGVVVAVKAASWALGVTAVKLGLCVVGGLGVAIAATAAASALRTIILVWALSRLIDGVCRSLRGAS